MISAAKDHEQIFILPIHSFMDKKGGKFDYQELIFKRDSYYSPKGDLFLK